MPTLSTPHGMQVEALGVRVGVKCAVLVGGIDMMAQAIALGKRPHIIVGTPGRVVDHLSNTKVWGADVWWTTPPTLVLGVRCWESGGGFTRVVVCVCCNVTQGLPRVSTLFKNTGDHASSSYHHHHRCMPRATVLQKHVTLDGAE